MRTKPAVLFIVSPTYSGSTLLTFLLGTHPEVSTIGERGRFYRKVIRPIEKGSQACSCGAPFTECRFWSAVRDEVEPELSGLLRRIDFSAFHLYRNARLDRLAQRMTLHYALRRRIDRIPFPVGARFREVLRANGRLIEAVLHVGDASAFVDASKGIHHLVYLSNLPDVDVYGIHLLRDGRGQVHSKLKRSHLGLEKVSEKWVQTVEEQRALLAQWGGPVIGVRYEELCAAPRETLDRLFRFCGLDPDRASLDFRGVEQHIMGNARTRTGSERTIQDRQEWRTAFSADDLAVFDRVAGDLNRSLGYH